MTDFVTDAADRAEERAARSRARLAEGMDDVAELASDMAAAGLISEESASETERISKVVKEKYGQLPPTATKFANDQLKSIIERIERLEEEKKTMSDDIREIYSEAKGNGYDVKALRTIVRLRKQDANERAEQETILETYMQALGML
jgi:uncharacterized protein (UPF0335 family)